MANENATITTGKPSALVDTRVIYCGDNLEQLKKLPDACVDLIYIDPPFNSYRNYEQVALRYLAPSRIPQRPFLIAAQ